MGVPVGEGSEDTIYNAYLLICTRIWRHEVYGQNVIRRIWKVGFEKNI